MDFSSHLGDQRLLMLRWILTTKRLRMLISEVQKLCEIITFSHMLTLWTKTLKHVEIHLFTLVLSVVFGSYMF